MALNLHTLTHFHCLMFNYLSTWKIYVYRTATATFHSVSCLCRRWLVDALASSVKDSKLLTLIPLYSATDSDGQWVSNTFLLLLAPLNGS
jgi:hypothetical protein